MFLNFSEPIQSTFLNKKMNFISKKNKVQNKNKVHFKKSVLFPTNPVNTRVTGTSLKSTKKFSFEHLQ